MSYSQPDVYYQPEQFDLVKIAEAEWPNLSYEFDIFAVWKHKDGRLFYGSDSGCSCPSPFENFTSLDTLTELKDFNAFSAAIDEWGSDDDDCKILIHEVKKAVAANA